MHLIPAFAWAAVATQPSGTGNAVGDALVTIATNSILGAAAILGLFVLWQWNRREAGRADRNEQAVAELNKIMMERVLPALGEASRALAENQATQRETLRVLGEISLVLRDLPERRGRG